MAKEWWRRTQEKFDRTALSEQVRADLEAIKDQIDGGIYTNLLAWIDRGEPDYVRLAEEKIESLADFHRMTWGQVDLPGDGSG